MKKFLTFSLSLLVVVVLLISLPTFESNAASTVYVNDYMSSTSSRLELYVAKGSTKQDGVVFKYQQEVFVLDGGLSGTGTGTTYNYLYKLRKSLLPDGVSVTNQNYKLKITLIVSHFHGDHVSTLINDIIPSPYFEVIGAYYPQISSFRSTSYYADEAFCDVSKYADGSGTTARGKFFTALKTYFPTTYKNRYSVNFGEHKQITSADGLILFDMFGPSQDWGTEENAKAIIENYYTTDTGEYSSSIASGLPVAVVNANSMWLKVSYADRTMLFTGDTLKKVTVQYSRSSSKFVAEPFDLMLEYYAELCGSDVFDVDVVKFPHHGEARGKAMKGVLEVMSPELLIFTTPNYSSATNSTYWDNFTGVDENGNMNYGAFCASGDGGMYLRLAAGKIKVCKGSSWSSANMKELFFTGGERNYAVYGEIE